MRQQRINGDTASFRKGKIPLLESNFGCSKYLGTSWIPGSCFSKKKKTYIYITSRKNPPPEIFSREILLRNKNPGSAMAFIWLMFLRQAFPAVDAPSGDNHQISWVLGSQVSTAEFFFQRKFMALQMEKKKRMLAAMLGRQTNVAR